MCSLGNAPNKKFRRPINVRNFSKVYADEKRNVFCVTHSPKQNSVMFTIIEDLKQIFDYETCY